MKKFFNKECLSVSIVASTFFLVTVTVAPHALAHDAAAQRIKQLEQSLQAIQAELQKIKAETAQSAQKVKNIEQTTNQTAQKVNTIEQTNAVLEERLAPDISQMAQKDRMLFFRGGFAHMMNHRNGVTIQSQVLPIGAQDRADRNGWYIGAGLDWNLTNDVWGILPNTSIFAELMFEYKEFGHDVEGNGAVGNVPSMLAGGGLNPIHVTVNQFTLAASPKVKFFKGSKLRPWIIPAGLAIHVLSPPSESITYIQPGVQFGAGLDYHLWKNFYIGIDGRYQLTAGKVDGINLSGMTAGGYLGIGF
ncbi:MAG TPA: porin family protein [Nitrosomonas sp.]|nr:porin family protein [Nitrosomonas sp.]